MVPVEAEADLGTDLPHRQSHNTGAAPSGEWFPWPDKIVSHLYLSDLKI